MERCSFCTSQGGFAASAWKSVVVAISYSVSVSVCWFKTMDDGSGQEFDGTFLNVLGSMTAEIRGNLFAANVSWGRGDVTGVSCNASVALRISENKIEGCSTGITTSGTAGLIVNNQITQAKHGIQAARGSAVAANTVVTVTGIGIHCNGSVFHNILETGENEAGEAGISAWCYPETCVTNNRVTGFSQGLRLFSASTVEEKTKPGVVVSGNWIRRCATGIRLQNGFRIVQGASQPLYSKHSLLLGNSILESTTASILVETNHEKCFISQNMCPDAAIIDRGTGNILSGNLTP